MEYIAVLILLGFIVFVVVLVVSIAQDRNEDRNRSHRFQSGNLNQSDLLRMVNHFRSLTDVAVRNEWQENYEGKNVEIEGELLDAEEDSVGRVTIRVGIKNPGDTVFSTFCTWNVYSSDVGLYSRKGATVRHRGRLKSYTKLHGKFTFSYVLNLD